MSDVTSLLNALQQGNPRAVDQLLPLVYDELRLLVAQKLAQEKPGQTLDATALVHEAYLRLLAGSDTSAPRYADHKHFFLAAAEAMRRILIDNARKQKRSKYGGGHQRLDVDTVDPPAATEDEQILAVDAALARLAAEEPEVAEVVRLRWFAGLTIEQSAAALSISVRTANRHWAYARAWLFQQLQADGAG
jgi:RNA polymerase sigma factor (TIGR02999 family)